MVSGLWNAPLLHPQSWERCAMCYCPQWSAMIIPGGAEVISSGVLGSRFLSPPSSNSKHTLVSWWLSSERQVCDDRSGWSHWSTRERRQKKASRIPCSKPPCLSLGGRRKLVLLSRDVTKMEGLTERTVSLCGFVMFLVPQTPLVKSTDPILRIALSKAWKGIQRMMKDTSYVQIIKLF